MTHFEDIELISLVRSLLEKQFSPTILEIKDESASHEGHAGAQGGMKHLALTISSESLDKMPRLLIHRAIYEALGELMHTRIHALRIKTIKSEQDRS